MSFSLWNVDSHCCSNWKITLTIERHFFHAVKHQIYTPIFVTVDRRHITWVNLSFKQGRKIFGWGHNCRWILNLSSTVRHISHLIKRSSNSFTDEHLKVGCKSSCIHCIIKCADSSLLIETNKNVNSHLWCKVYETVYQCKNSSKLPRTKQLHLIVDPRY